MSVATKYSILYVVLIVVVFIVTHMTSILTSKQTTELMVSSILLMFIMGVVLPKITGVTRPDKVAVYGFYYTLWYLVTKLTCNAVLKDENGVIITT